MIESARFTIVTLLTLAAIQSSWAAPSVSAVPPVLNFQGILLDTEGGVVADSSYDLMFRIYDDSAAGAVEWSESQTVATQNGLFNTFLGKSTPISSPVFGSSDRWLEVELIGTGPYLPRTRMGSVAYAFRVQTVDGATGGSIYGDVQLHSTLTAGDFMGSAGAIHITDGSDLRIVADGAQSRLDMTGPVSSATLDMANSGDAAVMLPDAAISAVEVLDEPGIAATFGNPGSTLLRSAPSMTDLAIVTIETPASGYILVQGQCVFTASGSTRRNLAAFQIDEDAGGAPLAGRSVQVGIEEYCPDDKNGDCGTRTWSQTVNTQHVFFKPGGAYEFRLEGRALADNAFGSVSAAGGPSITAIFLPTSYGSVVTASGVQVPPGE